MRRNVTLTLDDDLIHKARALLREELSRLVAEDEAYQAAKRTALERLRRGSRLGGGPLPTRDELHERAHLR